MSHSSPTLNLEQRRILLHLLKGEALKRCKSETWIETRCGDERSPAHCRFLLEHGYLKLRNQVREDAIYTISEQGEAALEGAVRHCKEATNGY